MNLVKILIIDNEPDIREILKQMIIRWANGSYIIDEASGVASGLTKINSFKPDIVMLDVEMDDGTGFDLLQKVKEPNFQLIFTTAHNKYAVRAFKFSAIEYLMKPIDPIELSSCLEKASQFIARSIFQKQLDVLMEQTLEKRPKEPQIVLKDAEKTYFVKLSDILFCSAHGAYTKFHLTKGDPIFMSRNLGAYEEILAPEGFIRTHHSCLVNPTKIKIYDRKNDKGTLMVEGGHILPISQRKKEFVVQFLEKGF